ncbi:MAG: WYL domain-containing protein [Acidimicrobiales bacterium]
MTKMTAGERLQRLLSLVPWVAAHDPPGPTVAETAARFDYPADSLLSDLQDVVFMVGVYPYSPDELIEVAVEGDHVSIRLGEFFERPLRLTPEQAVALVAAGAGLVEVDTDDPGPLRRGLAKLAAVLGVDPAETIDVELGPIPSETLGIVRDAVAHDRALRIAYYVHSRDEQTDRVIEPHRVFATEGHWYVSAHCRRAVGTRVFRLDRMDAVEMLEETFVPPEEIPPPAAFEPGDDDPRVDLVIDPSAGWFLDAYPVESVATAAGATRVTLAVSGRAWLERLLLQLGPRAEVVRFDPPLDADIASGAARRVLERYL